MKKITLKVTMLLLLIFGTLSVFGQTAPKNIIIFISDGWGYNHIDATNYWNGVDSQDYQKFSVYYPMSTYSSSYNKLSNNTAIEGYTTGYDSYLAWTDWKWMKRESDGGMCATGSGAAATTMATGVKTAKEAIGMDAAEDTLFAITERAIELGKTAGVVSSVQFSHATPASFSAHNISRNNYNQIAREQIIDSKLTVLMGCGNPEYDDNAQPKATGRSYKYVGDSLTWVDLMNDSTHYRLAAPSGNTTVKDINGDGIPDAWTLIQDSAAFTNLKRAATVPTRVIGVPKVNKTLQYNRDGLFNSNGTFNNVDPYENALNAEVPRLHDMTLAALNVLHKNDINNNGFFLMVEGGAVDWAGHGNTLGRIIEEQDDFNHAVDSTIAWLAETGELANTLIIVTGDHETGYLVGSNFDTLALDMPAQYPVIDSGQGVMPGHKFMSFNAYASQPLYPSGEHTNQLIPLYAQGPGAELFDEYADQEDFVRGRYIDNTDLGQVLLNLWSVNPMPEPKNVFLFISDGWSLNHMKAADYWEGQTQPYENWDEYYMSTYSATWSKNTDINWSSIDAGFSTSYIPAKAWTIEDWVTRETFGQPGSTANGATGSAAAATAMYSGVKTSTYAVGVDVMQNPLVTFGEYAANKGKSAGVVSSVQFTHATPACMFAHNNSRNNYAEIALEMLLDSKASVIMGCGAPDFNNSAVADNHGSFKFVGGEGTWNNLLAGSTTFDSLSINNNNTVQDIDGDGIPDAWTIIRDSADFAALATAPATPKRVLGIPNVFETLQYNRSGNDSSLVYDNINTGVPTLADMTKAAVNILDNNQKGFAVMIEGGAVDWAGHGNDLGDIIEEQDDFNNAVDAAIDWTNANNAWHETLIIVTGDHETGYLVGPNWNSGNMYATYDITDNGTGNLPSGQFLSGDHTNMLIPFYVKGEGSDVVGTYASHFDPYRGKFLDNTDIAKAIFQMWTSLQDGNPVYVPGSVSAIEENYVSEQIIKVFPTVTEGNITIEMEESPALFRVLNLTGQIVQFGTLSEIQTQISIHNLKSGMYILEILSGNKKMSQKIIKK